MIEPGMVITIPARGGKAERIREGQVIKVINTHGQQVVEDAGQIVPIETDVSGATRQLVRFEDGWERARDAREDGFDVIRRAG